MTKPKLNKENMNWKDKFPKENREVFMNKIILCSFNWHLVPEKKYDSSGWDCKTRKNIIIPAHKWLSIPLGFKLAMPSDCHADIRPRSGLARKFGVTVLNSPGLIDPDYRGEVEVILINHGDFDVKLFTTDRICQMVFSKDYEVEIVVNKDIYIDFEKHYPTERGARGFGSSGND